MSTERLEDRVARETYRRTVCEAQGVATDEAPDRAPSRDPRQRAVLVEATFGVSFTAFVATLAIVPFVFAARAISSVPLLWSFMGATVAVLGIVTYLYGRFSQTAVETVLLEKRDVLDPILPSRKKVAVFDAGILVVKPDVFPLLRVGERYRVFTTFGPLADWLGKPTIDVPAPPDTAEGPYR